jgi:hypothetical protein
MVKIMVRVIFVVIAQNPEKPLQVLNGHCVSLNKAAIVKNVDQVVD